MKWCEDLRFLIRLAFVWGKKKTPAKRMMCVCVHVACFASPLETGCERARLSRESPVTICDASYLSQWRLNDNILMRDYELDTLFTHL